MRPGDRKRHIVIVLAIAFALSGILVIGLSDNCAGQTTIIPVVQASNDNPSTNANVEPGNPSNGVVTNTGTITCDCGSQPQVDVDLTIEAGGWGATIVPSSMTFTWGGEDTQAYSVTVRAPPGTSHKVSQNVVVGGHWTGSLGLVGDVDESTFIIFIDQYFDLTLEQEGPDKMKPRASGNISITIWNGGNDEDDFIIEVDNLQELANSGWKIPTVPRQTIEEKGIRPIRISITAPSSEGSYQFEITVTSEGSQLSGSNVKSTTVNVFVDVKKEGSGSGGGGDGDSDEDDPIPFAGAELIVPCVAIALFMTRRRRG
jgi:hypothetical protein